MFANTVLRFGRRGVILATLLTFTLATTGCGDAKKKVDTAGNLKELAMAVIQYQTEHKAVPDNLDQIKSMIGKPGPIGPIGGGKDAATLMKNPLTGDNPGYEYVKPKPEQLTASSTTVVLYQLRDGKRDPTLSAAYLDGSVHEPDAGAAK